MNTNLLSNKVVKVLSQKIEYDWIFPFKNEKTKKSIGSGFFIDNKGHILTCSHVVENASVVYIEIPSIGDNKIEVKVLSICPELDIALLKTINFKNTHFFELHIPNIIYDIKPGVDVYAIGFPLGQDNIKFTKGILSGREKSLIQTDAPINPGNSGGPLLLDDKVIGINSSGVLLASNIGYAVPIEYYYLIKKELYSNSKLRIVRMPYLGLLFHNTNDELLKREKCVCKTGVYVKSIFKNSPIEKSGIKKNDILCSLNSIKIDNFGLFDKLWFNEKMKLNDILKTIKKNDTISLDFCKKGKMIKKNFKFNDFQLTINKKFPLYEKYKLDYVVFGGFIATELTVNLLDKIIEKISNSLLTRKNKNTDINNKHFSNILKYVNEENRTKKKVIITHIFPNCLLDNLNILKEFDIIEYINNVPIKDMISYKKALIKNKNYLEIITETNNKVVLNVNGLLKEELEFSNSYKYNLSEEYNYFKKSKSKSKSKCIHKKISNRKKSKKIN